MRMIDADSMKADLLTVDPRYEGMIQWCITVLDAQPTIEERKTGKWIRGDAEKLTGSQRCSICHKACYKGKDYFNYCPNCGADMRGETDETN